MADKILLAAKIAAPGAIPIENAARIVCADDHEKDIILRALRALFDVPRTACTIN